MRCNYLSEGIKNQPQDTRLVTGYVMDGIIIIFCKLKFYFVPGPRLGKVNRLWRLKWLLKIPTEGCCLFLESNCLNKCFKSIYKSNDLRTRIQLNEKI